LSISSSLCKTYLICAYELASSARSFSFCEDDSFFFSAAAAVVVICDSLLALLEADAAASAAAFPVAGPV